MTTTIKKGTGRPAAAAKRAKAAQKSTPTPADNLESMSLAEVRQLAVAQGWSTGTKGTKKEIIALLRKHPDGPPKASSNGKPTKQAAPRVRSFRPITEGLSGDGASKAARVAELLEQAGWKVAMAKGGADLNAKRGGESLVMAWTAKGRHSADDSSYQPTPDAKPRRIINVATCMRLARRQS